MHTLDLAKSIMENMVANINQSSDIQFTTDQLVSSDPTPIPLSGSQTLQTQFFNTIVSLAATQTSPVTGNKNVRYHRLHLTYDFMDSPRTLHVLTGKTSDEIIEIMRTTYNLHVDSVFTGVLTTTGSNHSFTLTVSEIDLLYVGAVTVAIVFV